MIAACAVGCSACEWKGPEILMQPHLKIYEVPISVRTAYPTLALPHRKERQFGTL